MTPCWRRRLRPRTPRSCACCSFRPSGPGRGRSGTSIQPTGEPEASARDGPAGGAALRTGGRILVDQLELNGTDLAFCLPGESYLPVLDALYDSPIRLITCRHEQGAANAAEAYGKLTGSPGSASSPAGRARPRPPSASTRRSRTPRRCSSSSARCRGRFVGARRGRSSTTATCSGVSRRRHGRSIPSTAFPSTWPRRSRSRCPAGPGRSCSRSRRTSSPRSPPPPMPIRSRPSRSRPRQRSSRAAAGPARRRRAPARRRGRGRLDRRDEPRCPGVLRGERASGGVRVSLPGLRRQPLAELRRRSRRGDGRGDRRAASRRRSRAGARRPPRRGATRRYTLLEAPIRSRRSIHVHPDASELGRVYQPDLALAATLPEVAAALRALDPLERRLARVDARGARRLRAESRARADGGRRRPRRDHGLPSPPASGRRGPDLRSRQLHGLGAPIRAVHAVRHAGVSAVGSMGYGLPAAVSRRSSSIRSAWSSASPVTATS